MESYICASYPNIKSTISTYCTVIIDNYDGAYTYNVSVDPSVGTINRVGDTIEWDIPDISNDYTYDIVVSATASGLLQNITRHSITAEAFVLVADANIVYNNDDPTDYLEGQSGETFVYTDGEAQEALDDDFYKAQVQMDIVNSDEMKVLGTDVVSESYSNTGDLFIDGEGVIEDENGVHTITNTGDLFIDGEGVIEDENGVLYYLYQHDSI